MGTVVVHAGMPKTGSTSVQSWLVKNAARLRERHGIQIVVATSEGTHGSSPIVRLERFESGRINSGPLISAWFGAQQSPEIAQRFIDDLARDADQYPCVLITAEALSEPFWRVDEPFLCGFERLALSHDVRIAYYVRPQHTAIEAGWREGGYKLGYEPVDYVAEFSKRLHYLRTLDAVAVHAPHVDFGMRPFRNDLLDDGSPVSDFAHRFLVLSEDCPDMVANPGLPLELVNLLRHAPNGWFWTRGSLEERYPRRQLREIFDGQQIGEAPEIRRSRRVLHAHCHTVFEPENQEVIRRLGWPAADFVPPLAEELEPGWDISELNDLWAGRASPAERTFFFHALQTALDKRATQTEDR